jgi:mycothiol conjugate amidase Mca
MAVHAHPDDECFGGGGTLARYSAEGHTTVLVTCTNGEEGEIVDPDMDAAEVKPRLADVRLGELNAAVGVLGITHLELLGYRDSGMVDTASNDDPRSFNKADPEEATGRLVALIRRHRPHVLFTYAEDGGYGHPDHLMAHQITVAAFDAAGDPDRYPEAGEPWTPQKLYYTAWLTRSAAQGLWRAIRERGLPITFGDPEAAEPPEFGTPDELVTTRIDIRPYVHTKLDALRAHRTQIRRDSTFLNLPDDLLMDYLGVEGFRLAQSRVAAPDVEDDLFAGLRG